MFKLQVAFVFALLPAILASPPIARQNTATTNVQVAPGGQLTFSTQMVQSTPGGTVVFAFGDDPHSATQSSFDAPCTPLDGGFDSGLQTNKEFTITITDDTKPVYVFSKAGTDCGQGMVMVINPPSGNAAQGFDGFLAAAQKIGSGEKPVSDSGFVGGGVGAAASAAPSDLPPCPTTSNFFSNLFGGPCASGGAGGATPTATGGGSPQTPAANTSGGATPTAPPSSPASTSATSTSTGSAPGITQSQSQSTSGSSNSVFMNGRLGVAAAALALGMLI
ncbi:hypothetical protein EIP91_010538 [Steccherinum ochraceum]|uniref:Phytocyanin domain-containing protein n=1 Tax=Steccherinum ochraceum TaxID=92696 RepID=A0A4R0R2P3_9APHY|nr:hypothetical protein EIP91_010538 [Steccherinum ochraceum]